MKISSHIQMGKYICDYVKKKYNIDLDFDSFIEGNVIPDRRLSFYTRPHYLKNNISYIKREINCLIEENLTPASMSADYSKRLGIICHYYADFFCHAHNSSMRYKLLTHKRYENELHDYFVKNYINLEELTFTPEILSKPEAESIFEKFYELNMEYRDAAPSCHNDLAYTILACVQAIVLITNASAVEYVDAVRLGRLALKTV